SSDGGGTAFSAADLVGCKCRNFNDKQNNPFYKSGGGGGTKNVGGALDPEAACRADNAAEITEADTSQYIEVNIYNATVNSDVVENSKTIMTAGQTVQAISVWSASGPATSVRGASGEGAPTFGGALTWASTQASNAITWTTGAGKACKTGTITVAAPPASNATVGTWQTWLATAIGTTAGWNCMWGNDGSKATDASCLAEIAQNCFNGEDGIHTDIRPRVRADQLCDQNGCSATVNTMRVFPQGIEFGYTDPWAGSQAAVTPDTSKGSGLTPGARYVLEKWNAFPSGGGNFVQHEGGNRWYSCDNAAGKAVNDALCDGGDGFDHLECGGRREMGISFIPSGTTGKYYLVFNNANTVFYAKLVKYTAGTPTTVQSSAVTTLCQSAMDASEGTQQLMTAEKQ
ncbi:MAG: hypothetical protein ABL958_20220, partial [Bdellovibrionia bacterium]